MVKNPDMYVAKIWLWFCCNKHTRVPIAAAGRYHSVNWAVPSNCITV